MHWAWHQSFIVIAFVAVRNESGLMDTKDDMCGHLISHILQIGIGSYRITLIIFEDTNVFRLRLNRIRNSYGVNHPHCHGACRSCRQYPSTLNRRERDTTASRHPTWLPDRSPAHTDQKLRTGLYCAQITLSSLVLAFVEDYDSGKPTPILPTLMNKAELQGRINHLNREDPRHQGELA